MPDYRLHKVFQHTQQADVRIELSELSVCSSECCQRPCVMNRECEEQSHQMSVELQISWQFSGVFQLLYAMSFE
jgi:hypothetical protein